MLPALLLAFAATPSARAEPPAFALLPFGIDLYMQKKPVRAILYSATQAIGVATAAYATSRVDVYETNEDETSAAPWKAVTAAGVTLTGASYVVSLVDASNLHKNDAEASAAWLRDWDRRRAALASAPSPTDRPI